MRTPIPKRYLKAKGNLRSYKFLAIALSSSGHIITTAHNMKGEGLISSTSIHAEEFLLRKLRKINAFNRFKGINVVVMRYTSSRGWEAVKPCEKCQRLLRIFPVTF